MTKLAAPTVSVVITVYNEEPRHLAEAIDSVQAQTVAASETIIVEDGALRDYRALYESYPDLHVVRQDNQGLAAARNTGLHAASSEFILFLDGDDRMSPESLAANLRRLASRPGAIMSFGRYRVIDGDGRHKLRPTMAPLNGDQYATMLAGNCIGMHATVLYRRDALLSAGGFDPAFRACEDYELYLRLARLGPILWGPEIIADYRFHGSNMSGNRVMMLKTALRVLEKQDPYVDGNPDWERARACGRAEWRAFYARGQLAATLEALAQRRRIGRAFLALLRIFFLTPFVTAREAMMEILRRLKRRLRHPRIDLGDLARTKPISRNFGYDRGNPVDRHYIEGFLARHAGDIRGRVLEIGDNSYTMQFGGSNVELSEVLHVDPDAPNVSYCTDLTDGNGIPDGLFDCVVLTQTLHLVYEFPRAVATLHRILKPGGILLLTVPGVSSVDRGEWGSTWFWSFTPASIDRLMTEQFGADAVEVTSHGNVLTATAFLYGLAESDLRPQDYQHDDPQYPVIVAARVTKGSDATPRP